MLPVPPRLASVALHVLFFCSGLASLVCEVVWFKQLGFVLGSSTFSATVVVSCFFGGLSLGSVLFGRWSDRVRHPLAAYGALELLLAFVAFGTSFTLSRWDAWIGWFTPWLSVDAGPARPLKVALALLILLPPTVLMGATLPVLSRWLVRSQSELAARIGVLYALNTLGAAVGCALVGFVLLGWIGVISSAAAASVVYATIGILALLLSRGVPAPPPATETPRASGPVPLLFVALFAVSGFVAIGYEVLWFRMLRYFAAHTVYTFSTFLAVYLLGLVLGAAICARWLAGRKSELAASFARVQLATGVAAFLSFAVLGRSQQLLTLTSDYTAISGDSLLGLVLLCGLVLLPPTVLLGLAFPLASELAVDSLSRLGSRIGLLYGANTLGGVLGSLVTGFVLLPLLGAQHAFELLVLCNLALFVAVLRIDPSLRARGLVREGALAVAVLVVGLFLLGPNHLRAAQTAFDAEVLAFRENEDATFVVLGYDQPHTGRYQQLVVNGTSYANNRPSGRRYMAMLGHLPVLLNDSPDDAVVICVGTGTTVGGVALHRDLERVYAVDLTRHVFDLAPHFVPINNRFHEDPRVEQVVADGRHFLLVGDERYDVLTFEPPPPHQAGVVNLYSREFYALADRRLDEGGVLAQWVPLHAGYEELLRGLVRTMSDTFPHVSLWLPNGYEGVLVASREPLRIDPARLAERMADPAVAADLAAVGIDSVEDLLATFVAADDALQRWVGDVPVLTDDLPTIEYFFAYEDRRFRNAQALAHREPVERWLVGPVPDPARLERARRQMGMVWRSEDVANEHAYTEALELSAAALALEPDDAWLRYHLAQMRIWEERRSGGP